MQPDIPRLIGKIRDAGLSPDAWPDALKSLTDALGIAGAACVISNKTTGCVDWVCLSGLSAEFQSDYINHYAPLDPYTPLLNGDLGWTKLSESLPDTVLRKSEWYNDFVLSCGVRDILGARVVETPSHFVTFGLHQQIGRRFGDNTAAIMQVVSRPLSLATLRHVESISNSPHGEQNSKILTEGTRYYFNVRNGRQYPDEMGRTFASAVDAMAHAALVASELAQDGDWDGYVISVADADGRIVAEIPVRK
jgi:hypothetical protein